MQSAISTMRTLRTVSLLALVLKLLSKPLRCIVRPSFRACTSRHAACSTHMCTASFRISPTAFLICTVHTCPTSPMPTCTGGVSTRLVQCIHSSNGTVSEGSCVAPAPASNMSCNMDPCVFCQENVCSEEGTCVGDACQCDPGYSGSYCQVQCCFIGETCLCAARLRCLHPIGSFQQLSAVLQHSVASILACIAVTQRTWSLLVCVSVSVSVCAYPEHPQQQYSASSNHQEGAHQAC